MHAQVDKLFFEDKSTNEREVGTLIEQGIRSSVASCISQRHSADRNHYLKKMEQFSWEAYQIRLAMVKGQGDITKGVASRAFDVRIDRHTSARTIRRSSSRPPFPRVLEDDQPQEDAQESDGDEGHLSDESSDEVEDDIPLSQRSARMKASGKRKMN